MSNKTMPERIYACRGSVLDVQGDGIPYLNKEVEYVRADLITGAANEPLKDGQKRWVRMTDDYHWFIATIYSNLAQDAFLFEIGRFAVEREDIEEIGPVIRPPEGEV